MWSKVSKCWSSFKFWAIWSIMFDQRWYDMLIEILVKFQLHHLKVNYILSRCCWNKISYWLRWVDKIILGHKGWFERNVESILGEQWTTPRNDNHQSIFLRNLTSKTGNSQQPISNVIYNLWLPALACKGKYWNNCHLRQKTL